jgi:N-acetylneuraminate lyase
MPASTQPGGILPAIVTPFDLQGRFDESAFERLLEYVYRAGVDGIYVCGQTGEGLQQLPEQRKRVAESAVRLSPTGKQVILHVGAAATADAVDLARHAASAGATAISSLPPLGAYSFEEVYGYYRAVTQATSLPFYVYYYSAGSAPIRSLDDFRRICDLPNVAGLKFTDMDLFKLSRLKQFGYTIFNGYDEILVAGLLMGADGGIGSFYNVIPHLFVQLHRAAKQGDWSAATALQSAINEVIAVGLRYPVHSAVKGMLSWLGLDCGPCLAPRRPLTAQETDELNAYLETSPHLSRASVAQ